MIEMQRPVVRWGLSVASAVAVAFLAAGGLRVGAQAPANGTGGPKEGITVHGRWTIDVRQPDGTLVTHREFENALTAQGAALIADVLSRTRVPGLWQMFLGDDACVGAGVGSECAIYENGVPINASTNVFRTLTLSPPGLTLRGTATAGANGQISRVRTSFFACESTHQVSECASPATGGTIATSFGTFSVAVITPAIRVVPDQLIQASVTYTFAAGETHVN